MGKPGAMIDACTDLHMTFKLYMYNKHQRRLDTIEVPLKYFRGVVWSGSHNCKQLLEYDKLVRTNDKLWCAWFNPNKESIVIKNILPESLCIALSKYLANLSVSILY